MFVRVFSVPCFGIKFMLARSNYGFIQMSKIKKWMSIKLKTRRK